MPDLGAAKVGSAASGASVRVLKDSDAWLVIETRCGDGGGLRRHGCGHAPPRSRARRPRQPRQRASAPRAAAWPWRLLHLPHHGFHPAVELWRLLTGTQVFRRLGGGTGRAQDHVIKAPAIPFARQKTGIDLDGWVSSSQQEGNAPQTKQPQSPTNAMHWHTLTPRSMDEFSHDTLPLRDTRRPCS